MKSLGGVDGFTLIEILIVVIIIAALATMILPNLTGFSEPMRRRVSKGDMSGIVMSLEAHRLEVGKFPKDLGALTRVPEQVRGRTEPYISKKKIVDPWGNPYIYRYPATLEGSVKFDLYSTGSDGADQSGEGDDVSHWEESRM